MGKKRKVKEMIVGSDIDNSSDEEEKERQKKAALNKAKKEKKKMGKQAREQEAAEAEAKKAQELRDAERSAISLALLGPKLCISPIEENNDAFFTALLQQVTLHTPPPPRTSHFEKPVNLTQLRELLAAVIAARWDELLPVINEMRSTTTNKGEEEDDEDEEVLTCESYYAGIASGARAGTMTEVHAAAELFNVSIRVVFADGTAIVSPNDVRQSIVLTLTCHRLLGGHFNGTAPRPTNSKTKGSGVADVEPPVAAFSEDVMKQLAEEKLNGLFTIKLGIPSDGSRVAVVVPAGATVRCLAAAAALATSNSTFIDSRFVFHGKVMEPSTKEIRQFGVRSDSEVQAAWGELKDLNALELVNVSQDITGMKTKVEKFLSSASSAEGDVRSMMRKALAEDCTKLLLRLDRLEGLSEGQRAERKQMTHQLNAMDEQLVAAK